MISTGEIPPNTWWLIPLSKWVTTLVITGISAVSPLITGVITHLLSGMSHQAGVTLPFSVLEAHTHTQTHWVGSSRVECFHHRDKHFDFSASLRTTYGKNTWLKQYIDIMVQQHISGHITKHYGTLWLNVYLG